MKCSYCGRYNKAGADKCEGCYASLPEFGNEITNPYSVITFYGCTFSETQSIASKLTEMR